MNIPLTRELTKLVAAKVKSGLYASASDVVQDALQLLEERDQLYRLRLQDLRGEVRKGLDQLDRGEGIAFDAENLKRRLRQELGKKKRRRAA